MYTVKICQKSDKCHPMNASFMKIPLLDLTILALDCQTTGANPDKGQLLEIGWARVCPSTPASLKTLSVQSYLIKSASDTKIPRAVQRITGITDETMQQAASSKIVWHHLSKTAEEIAAVNQLDFCPTVIHFARFEEPFLRDLHSKQDADRRFLFHLICTHEIAIRLLPGLPRRGIRAVAGYFGHSTPQYRRSTTHAAATALIWKEVVKRLDVTFNVRRFDQLVSWLADTNPPARSIRKFPMNPKVRRELPAEPGVYRMLRSNNDILYIGKAKSLKQRVNSYFGRKTRHSEHILEMLSQARDLSVTTTASALEAAVLESDEIKRHSPPYNIALHPENRRLLFLSKDFQQHSTAVDDDHCIGPIPEGSLSGALAAFGRWLTATPMLKFNCAAYVDRTILGLPPEYAPEMNCLMEGLTNFRQKHKKQLKRHPPVRALTALGARLWWNRIEALSLVKTAEDEDDETNRVAEQLLEADSDRNWTPEMVVETIESVVSRAAHLIRRARWLCMLSECSLAWEVSNAKNAKTNLIIVECGDVVRCNALKRNHEIPKPLGYSKSIRVRQANFDLATYDRLRVVTAELRRLIANGRNVRLRLGPHATLNQSQLEKALKWV